MQKTVHYRFEIKSFKCTDKQIIKELPVYIDILYFVQSFHEHEWVYHWKETSCLLRLALNLELAPTC